MTLPSFILSLDFFVQIPLVLGLVLAMGAACSSRSSDGEGDSFHTSHHAEEHQSDDAPRRPRQDEQLGLGTESARHVLSVAIDDAPTSSKSTPRTRSRLLSGTVVVNDDGSGNRSGGGGATLRSSYRGGPQHTGLRDPVPIPLGNSTSRQSQGATPSASPTSTSVGYHPTQRINPFAAHELIHLNSNNGSLPPLSVSPTTRLGQVALAPSSTTSWMLPFAPTSSGSPSRRDIAGPTVEDEQRRMASSGISPASPSHYRRQTSQSSKRSQYSATTPRGFKSVLLPEEAPALTNLLFDGQGTPDAERTDSTVVRYRFGSRGPREGESGTFTARTMSADFGSVVDEEEVVSQDSQGIPLGR